MPCVPWRNATCRILRNSTGPAKPRLAAHFNSAWCHHLNDDDVATLVSAGRLNDFTHDWSRENGWQPKDPPVVPTAREVNLWSLCGMGHDGVNQWKVTSAEAVRLGLPQTCPHCGGEGCSWPSPEAKEACEAWERSEPPAGEGYQIWETVSEGSPVSPVFATPGELARWMAANGKGVDDSSTVAQWMAFIEGPGWAPSFVAGPHGIRTGVEAVSAMAD
jgi:hypothetical protein